MRTAFLVSACVALGFSQLAVAQVASGPEQSTTAAGSSTVRPIPNSDVMYKKEVWRMVDLREKQNKPMFAKNREISKIIIDAVRKKELTPYVNDSLTRTLELKDFNDKLLDKLNGGGPQLSEEEKKLGFTEEESSGWGDDGGAPAKKAEPVAAELFPFQLYQMQVKEEMVFDKKRSRMYHQIQSITLFVPAQFSSKSADEEIATFKYADLAKVFRNNPEQAVWFNRDNDAQHKNLADAFDLWLFSSYIVKVSNPDNKTLTDLNGGNDQQGIMAAQQVAGDMIEYEYNLWSF